MSGYVCDIMPSYQPLDNNLFISLRFCKFALITVSLPFAAFILCVVLCLLWNFESSTATHCRVGQLHTGGHLLRIERAFHTSHRISADVTPNCIKGAKHNITIPKVPNYLPSISAAIGGFEPQRYIWRILIAIHATPRILIGIMYWMYYNVRLATRDNGYKSAINVTAVLYLVEVASLIGLSYISSIENKGMHEKCFIGFTLCSVLHMLFTVGLHREITPTDSTEMWSKNLKLYLTVANISSIAAALYFYYRHNAYCEPLVYTCFAFCEYIFVLTNMGFHLTAYYDFSSYCLVIGHEIVQKIR